MGQFECCKTTVHNNLLSILLYCGDKCHTMFGKLLNYRVVLKFNLFKVKNSRNYLTDFILN